MKETDGAEDAEKMQHGPQGGMNMPGMDMPSGPQAPPGAPRKDKAGHMDHSMPGGMKMDKPMPDGMKMDKAKPGGMKKGEAMPDGMKMDKAKPGGMKKGEAMPDGMKMPPAGQKEEQQPPQKKMNQHDGAEMKHDGLEKAIDKTLQQQPDAGETKHEDHQ